MVLFRTIRHPLFPKPVSWLELFLPFLTARQPLVKKTLSSWPCSMYSLVPNKQAGRIKRAGWTFFLIFIAIARRFEFFIYYMKICKHGGKLFKIVKWACSFNRYLRRVFSLSSLKADILTLLSCKKFGKRLALLMPTKQVIRGHVGQGNFWTFLLDSFFKWTTTSRAENLIFYNF